MLLGTKKTLYDHITEALLQKSHTAIELGLYLKDKNVPATVQGIYKALRELISEDVVVKQGMQYVISNVWREKAVGLFAPKSRFKLSPGEDAIYRFKRLDHLDAFWKHVLADIEIEIGNYPTFHFTPHQFWSLVPGRKESEQEFYKNFEDHNIYSYTVIGGTTHLDKIARDSLKNNFHQIHLDEHININRRDHISILGSYVVTTRISGRLAQHIDMAYETEQDEKNIEKLISELFKKLGSVTMIVEHNEHKAQKLRKRLAQDFHIPRELQDEFNLF